METISLADLDKAIETIRGCTGEIPNTVYVNKSLYKHMERHQKFTFRYYYLWKSIFKNIFDMESSYLGKIKGCKFWDMGV